MTEPRTIFDVGDQPTVTAQFRNLAGVLTDTDGPGLTVKVLSPAGVQTTTTGVGSPGLARTSTGVYTYAFQTPFDVPGEWICKFFGTAGLVAAQEIALTVRPTRIT